MPILLSCWGAQLYGEWLILLAIPAYLSIGDIGFAGTACKEMTILSKRSDNKEALQIFQSTWILLSFLTIGWLAITFLIVSSIHTSSWFPFKILGLVEIKTTLLLLISWAMLGFQAILLQGGFWISGYYSKAMYHNSITQLLEFFGIAAFALCGKGPVFAAFGCLCGRVIGVLLMWYSSYRLNPWLKYGKMFASFKKIRSLFVPAISSTSFPLSQALNVHGVRLIIGFILGPASLALFVPLRTLSRFSSQIAKIVNRLVEPELAMAFGRNDETLLKLLLIKSCQISIFGFILIFFLLLIFGQWLFPFWTNGKLIMQWPVFLTLVLSGLPNSILQTSLMVPQATNRHMDIALLYFVIVGLMTCLFSYFGAIYYGIIGVACSILLIDSISANIIFNKTIVLTNLNIKLFFKKLLILMPNKINGIQ